MVVLRLLCSCHKSYALNAINLLLSEHQVLPFADLLIIQLFQFVQPVRGEFRDSARRNPEPKHRERWRSGEFEKFGVATNTFRKIFTQTDRPSDMGLVVLHSEAPKHEPKFYRTKLSTKCETPIAAPVSPSALLKKGGVISSASERTPSVPHPKVGTIQTGQSPLMEIPTGGRVRIDRGRTIMFPKLWARKCCT